MAGSGIQDKEFLSKKCSALHVLLRWLGGENTWGFKHPVQASKIRQLIKNNDWHLNETPELSHPELVSGWTFGNQNKES